MAYLLAKPFNRLDHSRPVVQGEQIEPGIPSSAIDDMIASKGCVILLNGFPGIGKLTIAKKLQALLTGTVETRLLDNHLFVDLGRAAHPNSSQGCKYLIDRVRDVVFDSLKWGPGGDAAIILTDCLPNHAQAVGLLKRYVDIARVRQIPFFFVSLSCERLEHFRRVQDPERVMGPKTKVHDPQSLSQSMKEFGILDNPQVHLPDSVDYTTLLFHKPIDTSRLSAEESARSILEEISVNLPALKSVTMGSFTANLC